MVCLWRLVCAVPLRANLVQFYRRLRMRGRCGFSSPELLFFLQVTGVDSKHLPRPFCYSPCWFCLADCGCLVLVVCLFRYFLLLLPSSRIAARDDAVAAAWKRRQAGLRGYVSWVVVGRDSRPCMVLFNIIYMVAWVLSAAAALIIFFLAMYAFVARPHRCRWLRLPSFSLYRGFCRHIFMFAAVLFCLKLLFSRIY